MALSSAQKPKRNYYISYLKGWAILSIMLIHLLDWSNFELTQAQLSLKDWLYPGVLFFIATAGSVVYIAYAKYDNIFLVSLKLFRRGAELIGIYFLYNILKLYFYNFSQEPFYGQFAAAKTLNLSSLLALKSFTVPISIILSIGIYLLISPIFLYLAKKLKRPRTAIGLILVAVIIINYFIPLPSNGLTDFLYARGNIMFPLALWLIPFLIGFYLAMIGFEKHKGKMLIIFSALTAVCALPYLNLQQSLRISYYMYPLKLYYIFISFAFMFLLVYAFWLLEKFKIKIIKYLLAILRLLGDSTLAIYIYQWLIIDLTLLLFYPGAKITWLTVSLFLILYLAAKKKKIIEYASLAG